MPEPLCFGQKALLLGSLAWLSCTWCFRPFAANITAADTFPGEAVRCRKFSQSVDPTVFSRQHPGHGLGCEVASPTGSPCQAQHRLDDLTAQALTGRQRGFSTKPEVEPKGCDTKATWTGGWDHIKPQRADAKSQQVLGSHEMWISHLSNHDYTVPTPQRIKVRHKCNNTLKMPQRELFLGA